MANKKSEYTRKQAIALLLTGKSIASISKQLNISDTTIDNWLKDKNFRNQLKLESDNLYNVKIVGLMGLLDTANNELREILENSTDRNKLQAIKLIYEMLGKYHGIEMLERIEKIEEKIKSNNDKETLLEYSAMTNEELEKELAKWI